MRPNLLAWQWSDYADKHADGVNVALHLAVVPLSWVGAASLLAAPLAGWNVGAVGAAALVASLVAQGRGHAREANAPTPFAGPADFASRFLVEQFVTFPRFVLSGGAARALSRR
jgi:hypothetical protein